MCTPGHQPHLHVTRRGRAAQSENGALKTFGWHRTLDMTRPAPEGENENRAQNLRAATRSLKHLLAGGKEERDGREKDGNGCTAKNEQVTEQRVGKMEASEEYK